MTAAAPAAGDRVPCSVVIAAKDEGDEIGECIASVAWAAEVIVVENDSTDDTVAIARTRWRDRIQSPVHDDRPTAQRGDRARAPRVDSRRRRRRARHDEPARRGRADRLRTRPATCAFRVRRRNFFLGREIRHGGWERDRPVRLFRSRMRYDERPVHEHVMTDGTVGELTEPLIHYPYASLGEYFAKLDRYSRWWAEQNFARGRRTSAWTIAVQAAGAVLLDVRAARVGFSTAAPG